MRCGDSSEDKEIRLGFIMSHRGKQPYTVTTPYKKVLGYLQKIQGDKRYSRLKGSILKDSNYVSTIYHGG